MAGRSAAFQSILLSILYVGGIYAELPAGHEAETPVGRPWRVSETNKWQTFNDWTCNAPAFAEYRNSAMGGDVATYISQTEVETAWGPLTKDRERILSFGLERNQNGTEHMLETWIYTPELNSWRKMKLSRSLERPPGRIGYRLVTLCDTTVIVMGGFQMTENSSIVWLDDVWLFDGNKEVWNEINVYNQNISPLRWILYSVAVQASDTDSKCTCKESVFFFTTRNRKLSFHKLRCLNDDRVYAWETGNFTSRAPRDCLVRTISYNPTTFYIVAMAREGLWRYSPSDNYWQLVNVSVKASHNAVGVHFKNDRRLADRYVLFGDGIGFENKLIWVFRIFQRQWHKETIVGYLPYFNSAIPPVAALWGRLVTYTSTNKPCNHIIWDIRPDKEKRVWTWSKVQSQRQSPPSTIGQLTDIVRDHLYVIGGTLSENFYDQWIKYRVDVTDFWQLNLNEMMWQRLTPLPNRRVVLNTGQAGASGGILYASMFIVCGEVMGLMMDPSSIFDIRAYMFETGVWVEYIGEHKPAPRNYHKMVAINESSLLMFGGQGVFDAALQETWIMTLPEVNSSIVYWSQILQNSSDVPDARYYHTMVLVNSELVVLYGGLNASGHCLTDIWHFNVTQRTWTTVFLVNSGLSTSRENCHSAGTAVGQQVFITVMCYHHGADCDQSGRGLQIWMYSLHYNSWTIVSSTQTNAEQWTFSTAYWKGSLLIYDAWKSQLLRIRVGCPAGCESPNISDNEYYCRKCFIGYFSDAGASECTRCPGGLLTTQATSTSILNCTECDTGQCKYGECLVIQIDGIPRPTCRCSFGYTGSRCQYPTYFLIGLGIVVFVLLLVTAVTIILRVRANKRRREASLLRQVNELTNVWQISDTEIELFDRIGRGGGGEVFRAAYRDITVAVKILSSPAEELRVQFEFEREIQFMQTIRHPNIVLFIGAGRFHINDTPFIVIEFMENGSVRDLLDDEDRQIADVDKVGFWNDVAKGMCFLHSLDPPRIHRDLKCSNLLLGRNSTVKIADFGTGKQVNSKRTRYPENATDLTTPLLGQSDEIEMTIVGVGTAKWRAPEVSAGLEYSTAADVYSFGIVMWEIWTRQMPFSQYGFNYLAEGDVRNGARPTIPLDSPEEYRRLMMDCWHEDPSRRPTFGEIRQRVDVLLNIHVRPYDQAT